MTNIDKVKKAVEYINAYKHYNFIIVRIKEWNTNGVEIELNVGYKVQGFGFTDGWFTFTDDPLNIDERAKINHIHDEDKRAILRIAYYLIDWYIQHYMRKR